MLVFFRFRVRYFLRHHICISTAAHFEIVFPRRFDIEKPTQEAHDLSRCRTRVSPPLGTHETRRGEVCRADTTSIPRLIIFKVGLWFTPFSIMECLL